MGKLYKNPSKKNNKNQKPSNFFISKVPISYIRNTESQSRDPPKITMLAVGSLALPEAATRREAGPHRCAKDSITCLKRVRAKGRALTIKSVPFHLEKSKLFHQPPLEDFGI